MAGSENNFPGITSQFAMHFCMTAIQNIFCVAVFFHTSVQNFIWNIYPSAEIANQIWGGKLFPAGKLNSKSMQYTIFVMYSNSWLFLVLMPSDEPFCSHYVSSNSVSTAGIHFGYFKAIFTHWWYARRTRGIYTMQDKGWHGNRLAYTQRCGHSLNVARSDKPQISCVVDKTNLLCTQHWKYASNVNTLRKSCNHHAS